MLFVSWLLIIRRNLLHLKLGVGILVWLTDPRFKLNHLFFKFILFTLEAVFDAVQAVCAYALNKIHTYYQYHPLVSLSSNKKHQIKIRD